MAKRIFLKKRCTYKCIYMNSARLKNVKFPVFIVSPLEIRRMVDKRDATLENERAKPYGVRPSVA